MSNFEQHSEGDSLQLTDGASSRKFSVSPLVLARRWVAVLLTPLLCFSLFMAELTRFNLTHHFVLIDKTTPIYIILVVFSLLATFQAIMAVKEAKATDNGIELANLFWREQISWSDLAALHSQPNLKFAWLRSKRSFYLFVKTEISNYPDLEALIRQNQIN